MTTSQAAPTYRVIQWATGKVGRQSIRHFVENSAFELVGVLVTNPNKVGKDAGELAGLPDTGVIATDDVNAIVALDADCVHFAPQGTLPDLEMVCRLLRSGKNVVTPLGPFFRTERTREYLDTIEAAGQEGGTSFHGSGLHPGYMSDLLPLTLIRLMSRIDRIHVYETVNFLAYPSNYIPAMGFGRAPDDVLANPSRSADTHHIYAQSMEMIAHTLGATITDITTTLELATATADIAYPGGLVEAGTVAGQHYEWTAWADGAPLITFHGFWIMGDAIEPRWDCGDDTGYRVVIEGDPGLELNISRGGINNDQDDSGALPWTGYIGANAIPDVCDAPPGVITHLELGVVRPRGLVRPGSLLR
ncbi:hypothetical protein CJ178_04615 [Rhodococcus sp. ACPA4]|uniref:NAD(P)H-dependent amine dehydrogenase family protein n=1 Tax=Rhodococcus sp. ACPA4 TaxID=2028571 RepID=UPI000BB16793|nr:hypothetical protein [Rhodococcus sp. ACPA4]PBC40973.1 hypothetical protein CJ178_04615 [Rhodococcus sp. ACPA4]